MTNQNKACSKSYIAGVSFSIHPMSDQFIEIIKGALKEVDTSKVHMKTDDVTTTVRGKLVHVFDVTKAIFLHAAKTGEHVAFQATYSLGCPGDSQGEAFMAEDETLLNSSLVKDIKQSVASKFSLYPLGGGDYMDVIYAQIEAMKKHVSVSPTHYSTRLDGEAVAIFDGLENVFQATVEGGSSHTVMTVSISANSPSHKGDMKNG
ncbi:YkoF family thiamine/hydroxymethylpyrimidine-binding protein [Oceanobacillus longus]|uniref:YkoF family thiamine/hydroxymethylpyrimidine-binding protein n=1 Tax=Oceanobacillus longus TaxID=930120 RepID=A0ABV8GXF0_9BACI